MLRLLDRFMWTVNLPLKTLGRASRTVIVDPNFEGRTTRLVQYGATVGREYVEVVVVIGLITIAGWFSPFSYRALGNIYLLAVITLCLRVGRWPILFAAVISALAWNYVIMPPRLSFSVLEFDDAIILGTYFAVALIAGQVTAKLRSQAVFERQREQRATALFHLTRALAGAHTLDEAVGAALRQADQLFQSRTALFLLPEVGNLSLHSASSLAIGDEQRTIVEWVQGHALRAGRFSSNFGTAKELYLPMICAEAVVGVFVVEPLAEALPRIQTQGELLDAFTAQLALLVERERLRIAGEREKLLAESERLHRTLLDSVSHELKTPLAVLQSAAEGLGTEDPARQRALAGEITTATNRLGRLVANLLSQIRVESGALKPHMDWCDVRDLFAAARKAVGRPLEDHALRLEVPVGMPLMRVDPLLMEQVLGNLLLNACLHTPKGTALTLKAGVRKEEGRVFVEVSDEGPGLPAEVTHSLFEKFRRGNEAKAGGVGLGLSIVRGFMLAQGGDVIARNIPGGGASFIVYVPFVSHENVPAE